MCVFALPLSLILLSSCSLSLHRAHCYLPLPAAYILTHCVQLVSACTHVLTERDKRDMKVSHPHNNESITLCEIGCQ